MNFFLVVLKSLFDMIIIVRFDLYVFYNSLDSWRFGSKYIKFF